MGLHLEGQAQVPSLGTSEISRQRYAHWEPEFHDKKDNHFNKWLKFNIYKDDYKNKTPTEKALLDFKLFQHSVWVALY